MNYQEEMKKLYKDIDEAEKLGKNPAILYKRQIELLEASHRDFMKMAEAKGASINSSLDVLEMEIKHFKAMKQIAQKANFPTQKYDRYMYDARVRVLGKDFVNKHFDNN